MSTDEDVYNLRWMLIKRALANAIYDLYSEIDINVIDSHVNAAMDILSQGLLTDASFALFGKLPSDITFLYSIKEQTGENIKQDNSFSTKYSIIQPY